MSAMKSTAYTAEETRAYYDGSQSARILALLVISLSWFITALNLSASLVAIPAIARDLHADAVFTSWIPSAFLLSNLIALLPCGKLADLYGRKRLFLYGNVIMLLGSVLAGLSPTIEVLLFSRVIQGAGAAFIFGTGMALISTIYRGHGRGAALGWIVSGVYVGLSVGPWLGGWLTDHFGWHAVFLLPAPMILFGLLLGGWKMKGEWRADDRSPLDIKGSLLLAMWLMLFFFSIGKLPHWDGWLMALVSLVFLYAFIRHSNHSERPLIRLKLVWENRLFSRYLGASVMMYSSNYGLMFLLGMYFQYNRHLSASDAGKMLLLQAVVQAVLAPLAGRLSDRYQPRILTFSGCIASLVGVAVLLMLNDQSPLYVYGIVLALFGVGFGLFSTPNTSAAMASVSEQRLGIASALLNMGRLMGQMLGTAVVTLLLAWFIGQQKITPDLYGALLNTLLGCAAVSLLFLALASWFSMIKVTAAKAGA
ncbi:MAG: MFS transporter [Thiolinea sp.]